MRMFSALFLSLLIVPTSAQLSQKRSLGQIKPILKSSHARARKDLTKVLANVKATKVTEESFEPMDDPLWPGEYPLFGSNEELVLNIRPDQYTKEVIGKMFQIYPPLPDEERALFSTFSGGKIFPKQEGDGDELWSFPITQWTEEDTLYQVEVVDTAGDGICCGSSGYGWITVTDRDQNVLWSARGDYGRVAAAYFYKDALGNFELVSSIPSISTGSDGVVSASESESSFSGCFLCPEGTKVGTPDKPFLSNGELITCVDIEVIYMGSTYDECMDLEDYRAYWQATCSCPGYEPVCPLCGGNQVENPDIEFESEDSDAAVVTCGEMEFYFLTLPAKECLDWDSDTLDYVEDYCGCT